VIIIEILFNRFIKTTKLKMKPEDSNMLLFRDETFIIKNWIVESDFLVAASRLCLFIVNYICI